MPCSRLCNWLSTILLTMSVDAASTVSEKGSRLNSDAHDSHITTILAVPRVRAACILNQRESIDIHPIVSRASVRSLIMLLNISLNLNAEAIAYRSELRSLQSGPQGSAARLTRSGCIGVSWGGQSRLLRGAAADVVVCAYVWAPIHTFSPS